MGTHPIFESDFDCLTDNVMGAVPWDTLPDEIWTFILSKSSIQTLIQTQNVNRRFESLVQSLPIFQDFLHEEDSIIKALVTNWLGSPFDIVRPLTDPDWELLRPVLRARFRFLVKKSHGGFEDILLRSQKNDQSHYMVNKGWLNGPKVEFREFRACQFTFRMVIQSLH